MAERDLSPTKKIYIQQYDSVIAVFGSVFREVKELSRKKPEATLSLAKCKLINRLLDDIRNVVQEEPEIKYLERLDEDLLPQMGDAVLVMAQHDAALASFKARHYGNYHGDYQWAHEENWGKAPDWDVDEDWDE